MKQTGKKLICILLTVILMLGMLPASALAAGTTYSYTSNEGNNIQETDTFTWSDDCFLQSSYQSNDTLRLLSAQAAIASVARFGESEDPYEQDCSDQGQNIKALLKAMGFSDVETNGWYQSEAQRNSAAVAVGRRTVTADEKDYTLLAVVPRSAGYKQEWAGNFTVGDTEGRMHEGFKAARDEDLRFVKQYLAAHEISGDVKVWIAGHSRGGAVANLLGGFLAGGGAAYFGGGVSIRPEDVYCYTFATPRTVMPGLTVAEALSVAGSRGGADYAADTAQDAFAYTGGGAVNLTDERFNGIHNFPFDHDFITYLPPEEWGFTYYGRVEDMTKTADGTSIDTDAMLRELKDVSAFAYRQWTGGSPLEDYRTYPGDPRSFRSFTFDLASLSLVPGEVRGADGLHAFIDEFAFGFPALIPQADEYHSDYEATMTAFAGIYGMTILQYSEEYLKNVSSLIKPAVLSCLAYAYECSSDTAAEAQTATVTLVELLDTLTDGYYLSNDTDVPTPAKDYALTVSTDAFLERTLMYLTRDPNAALTQTAVKAVAGLIPAGMEETLTGMLGSFVPGYSYDSERAVTPEEVIFYTLYACGYGPAKGSQLYGNEDWDTAQKVRAALFSMIAMLPYVGVQLPEAIVPVLPMLQPSSGTPLAALAAALLPMLTGTDAGGKARSLADAADAELSAALNAILSEVDAIVRTKDYSDAFKQQFEAYKDTLLAEDNITRLREVLTSLTFRTGDDLYGERFDADAAAQKIATFAGNMSKIPPAHYNEVFVAWAKAGAAAEKAPVNPPAGGASGSSAVTIPVSGENAAVSVAVEVKGGTAAVKDADIDSVLQAKAVGTVTFDLSGLGKTVEEVVIPGTMAAKIAKAVADETNDADGLEIRLPGGAVTFDAAAVAAIAQQAGGRDLTLKLDNVTLTELPAAQQEAVKDLQAEIILDVSLTSGGQRISDFGGGKATVRLPFTLKDGQKSAGVTVWYVASDGTRTRISARLDGNFIVFEVTHFSVYVVAYDEAQAAACPRDASCPISAFTDADPAAWYHDGVHYVLENGVMQGLGNGLFAPDGTTSRAMVAQVLWSLAGRPAAPEGPSPFFDVPSDGGAWYADAVLWAAANGIVEGYVEGSHKVFAPDSPVTREQLAAMLYRYAKTQGEGFTGMWSFRLDFPDAGDVSGWALEAVSWWVMQGVINGMDGRLNPQGSSTRAQFATMLQRIAAAR